MKFLIALIIPLAMASDFTFIRPGFDTRFEGFKIDAIPIIAEDFYYNFSEPVKLNGLEVYCYSSNIFDSIDLTIEYYAGLDENNNPIWLRYKKFVKNYYIVPGFIQRNITHPAEPVPGTRLHIKFNFGILNPQPSNCIINILKFTDIEKLDTSKGEQGSNW